MRGTDACARAALRHHLSPSSACGEATSVGQQDDPLGPALSLDDGSTPGLAPGREPAYG
jgi:hypothetical protein